MKTLSCKLVLFKCVNEEEVIKSESFVILDCTTYNLELDARQQDRVTKTLKTMFVLCAPLLLSHPSCGERKFVLSPDMCIHSDLPIDITQGKKCTHTSTSCNWGSNVFHCHLCGKHFNVWECSTSGK
jgi:hypothetical protein